MADKPISQFPAASSVNASDVLAGVQDGVTKKFSFAVVLAWLRTSLANLFVPTSRTVNSKALSADITLDATDVGAYELPSGGIPKTDLAQGVQDSLDDADSAYQMPSGGIPSSDMASAVQTSLGKADTAYQKPSGGIPATDLASGVIPSVPSAYTSNPAMDGTASPGSSTAWAKGDHVHPSDSTKANQSQLAYVESGTTASRAYAVGEYFCWNGLLYRVKLAISSGASFTVGTNCEATTVANRIKKFSLPKTTNGVGNISVTPSEVDYQIPVSVTITNPANALYLPWVTRYAGNYLVRVFDGSFNPIANASLTIEIITVEA